jgi:hypothetical protein
MSRTWCMSYKNAVCTAGSTEPMYVHGNGPYDKDGFGMLYCVFVARLLRYQSPAAKGQQQDIFFFSESARSTTRGFGNDEVNQRAGSREEGRKEETLLMKRHLVGCAHTTGENGKWGETKQRSENQVAFNSVLGPS